MTIATPPPVEKDYKTTGFDMYQIQSDIRDYLHDHPHGVRQSEIAKQVLRIPSEDDHNWTTSGILYAMTNDGQVIRNDKKLFFLA